ncbi:hypothetical protein [Kribbella speibonae]|uniref:Uncharacterized protein n=1 Tax=Kribbella speibonae TaxID=1572660 RepID=A0ABY1ZSY3_9ACTN|nr:hypothetical protein [Kribbella speibonae]TCC16620.1 hypothetical protein E0H58_39800 [Kribbella speibonae]
MPVLGLLSGWRRTTGVGVLTLAAVLVALILIRGPDAPQTFGPWYPLTDQAGARASADFENHVPCTVDDPPVTDCQRVKLGVVLYGTPSAPSTYLISIVRVGTGDDTRETHEGTWTVTRGTALDPAATVYQLDASAPAHLRTFWPVSTEILYLLDQTRMPRPGTAAYGYALTSIPIGQTIQAPG